LSISAVDAIQPAFQHTVQQLLKPFRAAQWAKLALVGFLAGEMSSGGCSVPNFQGYSGHGSHRFAESAPPNFNFPNHPHLDPATLALLIAFLIVSGIVLFVLFIYLNSMMRFVLFDSVIAKECRIRQFWRRRHAAGLRYFVWQILFMLVTTGGMVILIGIPMGFVLVLGWLKQPREHIVVLILGGICLFFVFVTFMLVTFAVTVLTKDFVVPQMALENINAFEGWRRLLAMMKAEKGSYAGYIGMKIVLAIGAAILFGIVAVIVALVLLIPVGGLGAIAVLGGKAAGLTWNLYTITIVVVAGCTILAILLYVISLISVPAMVFFPAYSIYFFAARYPALGALIYPAPIPPMLPQSGPSFAASPEPIG
jgi:hypothetical protein